MTHRIHIFDKGFVTCFILLFLAMLPTNDTIFGSHGGMIRYAAQYCCLLIGVVGTFYKKTKYEFLLLFLLVFQSSFILSSLVNSTSAMQFLKISLRVLSLATFACFAIKQVKGTFFRALMAVLIVYTLINLYYRIPNHPIRIIRHTGEIYYLGSDNEATSPLLLLLVTSILYAAENGFDIFSFLGIGLPIFSAFFTRCGTAMMSYIVFFAGTALYFVPGFKRVTARLLKPSLVFVLLGIYYFILFSAQTLQVPILSDLVMGVTGKDSMTFTGRDVIWMEAIRVIGRNPVLGIGYGQGDSATGVQVRGFYYGAHNLILQWGVYAGLVAIVLFFILLYIVLKKAECLSVSKRYFVYLAVFTCLIAMSMENYADGVDMLLMLPVVYSFAGMQTETADLKVPDKTVTPRLVESNKELSSRQYLQARR